MSGTMVEMNSRISWTSFSRPAAMRSRATACAVNSEAPSNADFRLGAGPFAAVEGFHCELHDELVGGEGAPFRGPLDALPLLGLHADVLVQGLLGGFCHRVSLSFGLVPDLNEIIPRSDSARIRRGCSEETPRLVSVATLKRPVSGGRLSPYGARARATDRWHAGNTIDARAMRRGCNRCSPPQNIENSYEFPGSERCRLPPIGGSSSRHDRDAQA